ncbi:hypothetical protein JCM19232_2625 [Vibrio ishigakensis]|uniref:Uncharacterized protein n=1 Tax=Vibrio ishigakensis TaxID=1481914 RepID=A0A0B8PA10_9VIBR|nr:hypothetical protein JCM19232_2625 [Vibrio ishigakensis]
MSDDAFAWIMFAYVSAEDDDASYYKIKAIIGTELLNSAVSLKLDMAHRVADLAITEMVEQRELSKTHRATVLGVARASYYRNVHHYDGLLDMAKMVIVGWEVEAGMKILENSSC